MRTATIAPIPLMFTVILLFAFGTIAYNSDTTFGPIRVVPKEKKNTTNSDGDSDQENSSCTDIFSCLLFGSGDEDDTSSGCVGACISLPFSSGDHDNDPAPVPTTMVSTQSSPSIPMPDLWDPFADQTFHISFGVKGGGITYGVINGYDIGPTISLYCIPGQSVGARIRLSGAYGWYEQSSFDFERSAEISNVIFTQKFTTDQFRTLSAPLTLDLVIHPSQRKSTFFTVGGGTEYYREECKGKISSSLDNVSTNHTIVFETYSPIIGAGVNMLLGNEETFILFELQFDLRLNTNKNEVFSFGDNTWSRGRVQIGMEVAF